MRAHIIAWFEEICSRCRGTGKEPLAVTTYELPCRHCGGRGIVRKAD